MNWPTAFVTIVAILSVFALAGWVLWLIHDSEPRDE